jgi:DNA-binding GntR family transcriptional regulator
MGFGLIFHAAEAVQDRNAHNLMRDFHDEVSGYEGNERLVKTLEQTKLETGPDAAGDNLRRCYQALVAEQFFPQEEIARVDAWLQDLKSLAG